MNLFAQAEAKLRRQLANVIGLLEKAGTSSAIAAGHDSSKGWVATLDWEFLDVRFTVEIRLDNERDNTMLKVDGIACRVDSVELGAWLESMLSSNLSTRPEILEWIDEHEPNTRR